MGCRRQQMTEARLGRGPAGLLPPEGSSQHSICRGLEAPARHCTTQGHGGTGLPGARGRMAYGPPTRWPAYRTRWQRAMWAAPGSPPAPLPRASSQEQHTCSSAQRQEAAAHGHGRGGRKGKQGQSSPRGKVGSPRLQVGCGHFGLLAVSDKVAGHVGLPLRLPQRDREFCKTRQGRAHTDLDHGTQFRNLCML